MMVVVWCAYACLVIILKWFTLMSFTKEFLFGLAVVNIFIVGKGWVRFIGC